jgi:chromosome segregation ATPase
VFARGRIAARPQPRPTVNMRVDLAGANGDETVARISAQAARAAALQAVKASAAPRSRKVMASLPALEREVAGLEEVMDRLAAAVDAAYRAEGDDREAIAEEVREFEALKRETGKVLETAGTLEEQIGSARDTLAQLEEAGVGDAVEDDRALEELGERVQLIISAATAALDFIEAGLDEAAERRAAVGTVYDEY